MSKVKRLKPTTPGRRGMVAPDYSSLTKKKREKSLVKPVHRKKGRGGGKITTRHKGGGNKKLYRNVDFLQDKTGEQLKVKALEYDPHRSAYIALAVNQHGVKRYILAHEGLQVGDTVRVDEKTPVKKGNRMRLENIPVGSFVHNIEVRPGRGGQMARSAGVYAKVLAHDAGYTQLIMPSTEVRILPSQGLATIGAVSNTAHREEVVGKAGKNRHRGKRPHVRGSAMNPVDHPLGGGEGRHGAGRNPKTPWGKPAYGVKTRRPNKYSNRYIVRRRKKKKKRK